MVGLVVPNFDPNDSVDLKRDLTPGEINNKIVEFWVTNLPEISINDHGAQVVGTILTELGRTPIINIREGIASIYKMIAQTPNKYDTFVTLAMRANLWDHRINQKVLADLYGNGMSGIFGNTTLFESFVPTKDIDKYSLIDLFILGLKVNIEKVTVTLPVKMAEGPVAALRILENAVKGTSKQSSRR